MSTVKRPTHEAARAIFVKAVANAPVIGDLVPLVDFTMEQFFDPMRKMMKVKTERGTDFLTLGHMVSGAMMVGLVERCKANAFHRDIRSGTRTGITESDVLDAIDKITEENRCRISQKPSATASSRSRRSAPRSRWSIPM